MQDRAQKIDLILVFAACFVIILALWPRTTPVQIVRVKTAQGWKTYGVAVNDPRLQSLRDQLQEWSSVESDPEYATAKWQKELADFYRNSEDEKPAPATDSAPKPPRAAPGPATARLSDTIATVSYETPVELEPEVLGSDVRAEEAQAENEYWQQVSVSAEAEMRRLESAKSETPPISFIQLVPPTIPQLAFHFAFLIGIAGACLYMHWLRRAPYQDELPFREQSALVAARIGTFLGLNGFAILSCVSFWL